MTRVISPIAIDLGARYTGLFSAQYIEGEVPNSSHAIAATLVLPEEGGKMTWSQQERTATRHRVRSNKRRKLAKRLLRLCIQKLLQNQKLSLSEEQWEQTWEALCGLLNRRGFNRIEAETDLSALEAIEPYWFAETFSDHFVSNIELSRQWEYLSQHPEQLRALASDSNFSLPIKELKARMSDLDAPEKKAYSDAFSDIKNAVGTILQDLDYGHKHRKDYLINISKQIDRDSRFSCLEPALSRVDLWRLVGNISNLQLRAFRWYFNDKRMRSGDIWDGDALAKSLVRWIDYWRPQGSPDEAAETRARQIEFKNTLLASVSPLEFLLNFDPMKSIPPYEDQDNRRPPKDQTLWLDPNAMNRQFGSDWRSWAHRLRETNAGWDAEIATILGSYDRKTRLPKTVDGTRIEPSSSDLELGDTYLLQRILDRSRLLDKYKLRLLVKDNRNEAARGAYTTLERDLQGNDANAFLHFANMYYLEIAAARQGVWFKQPGSLLDRSDLNPPHKGKMLHILVGNVLHRNLDEEQLGRFVEDLWRKRVVGRSTLRGAAKLIEECRKQHGNLFNEKLRRMRYQKEVLKQEKPKWDKDQKVIWKIYEKSLFAADAIAEYYGEDDAVRDKYANPYSIAQLYTLLETDRKGFSRTTRAAHLENIWRMTEEKADSGEIAARCSRLSADSVRPFDGVLRRVLEHTAARIAFLKLEQVKATKGEELEIEIPVLVEENRFAFSESVLEIKKAGPKRRKAFNDRLVEQTSRWRDKHDRLRAASRDICPYSGVPLGKQGGERDHILPQSKSLAERGTVYNSEANLIHCSRSGNQEKGTQAYTLENLDQNYLLAVFGVASLDKIRIEIERRVEKLPNGFIFDALAQEDQDAVRHSLFLPEESSTRKRVVTHLAQQNATRVNGTQAWLARRIVEILTRELRTWAEEKGHTLRFSVNRVDAQPTSEIRRLLGESESRFVKPDQQGVASHAVDAMCVFAASGNVARVADNLAMEVFFRKI